MILHHQQLKVHGVLEHKIVRVRQCGASSSGKNPLARLLLWCQIHFADPKLWNFGFRNINRREITL